MEDAGRQALQGVSVASDPERGWVTVIGHLDEALQYPVVDLTILALDGRALANTMIVDATPEFQMTLHPRGAVAGDVLRLRVEVVLVEETIALREYEFEYSPE